MKIPIVPASYTIMRLLYLYSKPAHSSPKSLFVGHMLVILNEKPTEAFKVLSAGPYTQIPSQTL